MESGDVWYGRTSKRRCCENATVEWPVGIMQGTLRPGRFGKADYGGLRCCGMHTCSQRNATYARERGSLKNRHGCRISPFFHWNPSRNGDFISLILSIPLRPRQVIGIYSWRRTIAPSGWKRRHYGTTLLHPRPNVYTSIFGVATDARLSS
jgi:hypothetical protein